MPDLFVAGEKTSSEPTTPSSPGKALPLFSSYCLHPKGITFQNQAHHEQVVLFIRAHFITNVSWILFSLMLLALPLVFFLLTDIFGGFTSFIPPNFVLIITLFYYLIVTGYVFLNFLSWFYNVGIITNQQIFDIDFTDIMYRNVAKTRIEDVIDVEFSQGGFWHSFFDYGDVFVQTEGVKPNFEFHDVPNPGHITDIILNLKEDITKNG